MLMNNTFDQKDKFFRDALLEFDGARWSAAKEILAAYLIGRSANLLSYNSVCRKLKVIGNTYKGVKDIPVDAIVGSVNRCADFTRKFWPRNDNDKYRWAQVKAGMLDVAGVPPIDVYQIGGFYFVIDGHHRVSVARQIGDTHIQANIIETCTEMPLANDFRLDDPRHSLNSLSFYEN